MQAISRATRCELDQASTPLLGAMTRYVEDAVIPFHTPGHKQGRGMHTQFEQILGESALAIDLAVMHELDNLHDPHGCIEEAQNLASQLYGADHSFFVVNGTTGAVNAMIMTVVGPGEKIIIPRNAHRSVIGGVILSGAFPVYIQPEIDTELGIAMGVTPETVNEALRQNPDAKAVLLINPTYYGVASDLKRIIEIVHSSNIPAIVDEAHGPHLVFHSDLPIQALDAGADLCAQSTHKILGALTQASMLHCREGRINVSRLKAMLQLVQTTSPSYLLMASLDTARMQMATSGIMLIARTVARSKALREAINEIPGLYCFGEEISGRPGVHAIDPTKITVTVKNIGLTGIEAEKILRSQYNIQAELADMYNILFLLTLGDSDREIRALLQSLSSLSADRKGKSTNKGIPFSSVYSKSALETVISPREALFSSSRSIYLEQAEGEICAEIITVYPPGIPIVCPGERISREFINQCTRYKKAGLYLSGAADSSLETIRVV